MNSKHIRPIYSVCRHLRRAQQFSEAQLRADKSNVPIQARMCVMCLLIHAKPPNAPQFAKCFRHFYANSQHLISSFVKLNQFSVCFY